MLFRILDFVKNISVWKAVFFFISLSFAVFVFIFMQRSGLSDSDVILSIEGPGKFRAQESVEFEITLKNISKIEMHDTVLFLTLPDFLAFEDYQDTEQRINIGAIPPRGEISKQFVIFSKEAQKEGVINARAEYSPENLQGRFERSIRHAISVSSLPLTVILDLPQKAVSGQRIRGTFHFVSDEEIEKLPLFVKLDLPDGFILDDFEPLPFENTIWKFEKIEPAVTYRIEFEGVIRGSENEEKEIKLLFGYIKEDGGFSAQHNTLRIINISSSPLEFSQAINGKEEPIVSPGDELNFSIKYANRSGLSIEDITITVQLIGDIFDFEKIDTGLGYFNKNTRTIVWNKSFIEQLARLDVEGKGELIFSLPIKTDIMPRNYKDKNIFGISRAVLETSSVPLALKGLSLRAENESRVKLRTAANLFTRAYYYEGPFSNSGPIPPGVGEKTTYTILWQITNTFNDVRTTKIEAPLPGHVVFEGNVYPPKDNFKYNESTHSVLWDVGALSSGVGNIFPVETIAFQVSVTPEDVMRGQTFELIEQSKASGIDTFTGEFLEDFASPVNSSLPDDIGIQRGDGIVK